MFNGNNIKSELLNDLEDPYLRNDDDDTYCIFVIRLRYFLRIKQNEFN